MTDKERRQQDEIFDSALTTFDRVLFSALGYKYIRQPIEERRVIMQKYLEMELKSRMYEINKKYEGDELAKRIESLKQWGLKCEDWIQNKMK